MTGLKVFSAFDGSACAYVALDRLGRKVDRYVASEIDKYAMTVAANNFLDIEHVGDITKVDGHLYKDFDLLVGGSPCQGFSFAGKQLNFEDPRSKLFFEFVRLKNEIQPKYFFLENVVMKKEYQDVISSYLGVQPIMLNSAQVSAQSRKRLYWTNIPGYTPPEDKGLVLHDVLDYSVEAFYKYPVEIIDLNVAECARLGCKGHDIIKRVYNPKFKGPTLTTCGGGNREAKVLIYGRARKLTPIECERLQTLPDNYTLGVSNSQRYKMLGNGWTVDAVCEFFKHIPKDLDLF